MSPMTDLHPPKLETFDPVTGTNIDPKGVPRAVEEFREEPFGLYCARPVVGRAQFHYLESWLLPELGLRVTDFWFSPGHERDQDFYLDVVRFARDGERWLVTDVYLDIVLREGRGLEVLDTDELVEATIAGLLPQKAAVDALETAYSAVDGVAAHGYHLADWLATHGIRLTWRRR
jgi:predicted RNA-binding protein associated with RNAse of E/G family